MSEAEVGELWLIHNWHPTAGVHSSVGIILRKSQNTKTHGKSYTYAVFMDGNINCMASWQMNKAERLSKCPEKNT